MKSFTESGMTFGPYADDHCFRIEKSTTYRAIQDNVKVADFLLLRTHQGALPSILIVEAKQSSPRPETQPNFNNFIAEVVQKLTKSFAIGMASVLGRHQAAVAELPMELRNLDLASTKFRLVLIINGHKKEWLSPLQDALRSALHSHVKTWALDPSAVVVINHEYAKNYGLISAHSIRRS